MHFESFSMHQEAPRMAARLGPASGLLICVFSVFWHRFFALAARKTYENAYTFQACARPAAFCTRFLLIFNFSTVVFYDLGAFWMLLERLH